MFFSMELVFNQNTGHANKCTIHEVYVHMCVSDLEHYNDDLLPSYPATGNFTAYNMLPCVYIHCLDMQTKQN